MNAPLLFRRAALLQVLLALAAFAVADRNAWYLIAGGVLTVASTPITEGPRGRFLPNFVVSIGILIALGWGVLNLTDQPSMRAAGGIVGAVVLMILMLKLYGRKGPSDWRQILALTVVMVIAAALNSMDLLAGVLVMAYAGTALGAVMLYQLYAGALTAQEERRASFAFAAAEETLAPPAPLPTASARTGVPKPNAPKPDAARPNAAKPDAARPDAPKPDAPKPASLLALAAAPARPESTASPSAWVPAVPVVSGVHALRHFRRILVGTCAAGLAVSVLVFLLFPRDSVLGERWQGGGRQSGFTDEVVLLSTDRISLSAREVFSVKMLDPMGVPAKFVAPLHLRGAVLDIYSAIDRRWLAGDRRAEQFTATLGGEREEGFVPFAPEALEERANVWTQVVAMRSLASKYVFAMWLPIGISTPDERTFALNAQTAVIRDENHDGSGRPWSYSVRVQPFPGPRIARAVCPASGSLRPMGFPIPQVGEIAAQVILDSGVTDLPAREQAERDPEVRFERNRRIARLFTEYLSKSEFAYSTDLSRFRPVRGEDPNVSFLTRYRFGHCEFFASALAALCRSVGVDARVVTGYLATEYDDGSAEYVVREANAHAWVEVRTGEWQWSTFDPSPSEALMQTQNSNRSWLDRFRWVLDPIEFAWQSRVVNFDSGSQAEMVQRVSGGLQEYARRAAEWASNAAEQINRAFRLGPAGYLWLGLVAVVGVIAVVAVGVVLRRDRLVRERLGARRDRAARRAQLGRDASFYLDALDALARHGVGKPSWRTPAAHAESIRGVIGAEAGDALDAVVARFYAVRYAGHRPGRGERSRDAALVVALRGALARRYTR